MSANSEYLIYLRDLRREETLSSFTTKVSKTDKFNALVDRIMDKTMEWAEANGLSKPKKDDTPLSGQQEKWRDFFRDHYFDSMETCRTWADALTELTGIDMAPFIKLQAKPKRAEREGFPSYIVIVPRGPNPNGHNYKMGQPIINLTSGSTFYRSDGTYGNNMATHQECFRLPEKEEVEKLIVNLLYNSPDMAQLTIMSLLGR